MMVQMVQLLLHLFHLHLHLNTPLVVVSNVKGTFSAGETVSGQTSNVSGTIQSNILGRKGVELKDITAVKQIGMAGSPTLYS